MASVIGIDLGGTNIRAGRVDSEGGIVRRANIPTEAEKGGDAVMDNIIHAADEVMDDTVQAAAVVSPGVINPYTGEAESIACNIPGWEGMQIGARLKKGLGIPGFAENDGNAACLAEAWLGAGRGRPIVLIFTLGTGIGGGIVCDGKVFHGVSNKVAEFGHISVEYEGAKCGCGNTGCLELYASAGAVRREARRLLKEGRRSLLAELAGGDVEKVDAKEVCEGVRRGDGLAVEILDRAMGYLAAGVGSLINVFNPSVVVIGGAMSLSWDVIEPRLMAGLRSGRAFAPIFADCEVKAAELGDNAGILGAARVAWQGTGRP
ncbi:MAG: ROK family protein [Planctomycetes bacterium]|nr:ROK family protein [Planctomycetota bacterium]